MFLVEVIIATISKKIKSSVCLYLSVFLDSYKLVLRDDDKQMEAREAWKPDQFHVWKHFYVWDHVTVALHVDKQVPSLFIPPAVYR